MTTQSGPLDYYGTMQVRGLKLGIDYATSGTQQVAGRPISLSGHVSDNERVYHVQDQRYSFDVTQTEDRRDQLFVPVRATVEGP